MDRFASITCINVEKMIIAIGIMGGIAIVIFLRRRRQEKFNDKMKEEW